jgi:hypothetical protein
VNSSATAPAKPPRYWGDTEIACVLKHLRRGLAEARSGQGMHTALDYHLVAQVRAGAGPRELAAGEGPFHLSRLDAELVHAVVALMAGSERAA